MTSTLFAKTIKSIVDMYGQPGVLHNVLSESYDPVTGTTTKNEQTIDIMYAVHDTVSTKDINLKEKFIQRDDNLAKFETASVSFYVTDPAASINVNELSYIAYNGVDMWLHDVTTIIVNNTIIAYIALIREER